MHGVERLNLLQDLSRFLLVTGHSSARGLLKHFKVIASAKLPKIQDRGAIKMQIYKKKVLFLCTHNSARSQMAEGLLRAMYADRYEACSAGVAATSLDPRAVQAMLEIGIDISASRSKSSQEFLDTVFDLVVTVCDRAKEACPICSTQLELPGRSPRAREVIHKSFADPAAAGGVEEEQLEAFRRVRDEIKEWISQTFVPNTNALHTGHSELIGINFRK
jgi:arsenate reductase (thioredoxin)